LEQTRWQNEKTTVPDQGFTRTDLTGETQQPAGAMSAVDHPAELERLGSLCASLRTRLAEAVAAKSSAAANGGASASAVLAEGSLTLIDLKAVNRSVWELVNSYKERTQRANAGVDAAELKLQNLQYEKNHFLREITHLRDFRLDTGPKITLIDEAAFAREAPPELLRVSKSEDAHQFHLNRLQLELRQRKALCEVRRRAPAVPCARSCQPPASYYSAPPRPTPPPCRLQPAPRRRPATRAWRSVRPPPSATRRSRASSTGFRRSSRRW
jgi:hypothetical protein